MATRIGRNQPCPCGSGQKYKKCCLPKDEAQAEDRRAVLTPEVLDAGDEEDSWLDDLDTDDADDALADADDWDVDVQAITRVCYTHGMVGSLADLRRGAGVSVIEWKAPDIPAAILESFELEEIAALDGVWGNGQTGDPIQVDIVDVMTEARHLTIEIFNRAMTLLEVNSEEIRSLHRFCETLQAVSAGGTEAVRPPVVAAGPRRRRVEAPDQPGVCDLCGQSISFADAGDHALTCAPAHDSPAGAEKTLVQLAVTAPGLPPYWLRIEVRSDATLEAIDRFLRDIWLECCGHLSMFRIGDTEYFSGGFDLKDDLFPFPRARPRPVKKVMTVRLDSALPSPGTTIEYEYDFGSTTALHLRVTGERRGRLGRAPVRLLVRNAPVAWTCAVCGAPATLVCPFCPGDPAGLLCKRHLKRHPCDGGAESFAPVVNSPRMGVCGYTGA